MKTNYKLLRNKEVNDIKIAMQYLSKLMIFVFNLVVL